MSARLSPDGLYYWDGAQWVSTISHDGRSRWDGQRWVPLQGVGYAPAAGHRTSRRPTSWTRPLQYVIAAYYALAGLYAVTLPFTMGGVVTQVVNQSIQHQQSLYPQVSPPPAGFADTLSTMFAFMLGFVALFSFAIAVVAIIAALKRWVWAYYVIMVLLGLGILGVVADVAQLVASSTFSNIYAGFSLPVWIYLVGIAAGLLNVGLFVWMLVAIVRYGPWAMKRVEP